MSRTDSHTYTHARTHTQVNAHRYVHTHALRLYIVMYYTLVIVRKLLVFKVWRAGRARRRIVPRGSQVEVFLKVLRRVCVGCHVWATWTVADTHIVPQTFLYARVYKVPGIRRVRSLFTESAVHRSQTRFAATSKRAKFSAWLIEEL